jgi:hypothetical protein
VHSIEWPNYFKIVFLFSLALAFPLQPASQVSDDRFCGCCGHLSVCSRLQPHYKVRLPRKRRHLFEIETRLGPAAPWLVARLPVQAQQV